MSLRIRVMYVLAAAVATLLLSARGQADSARPAAVAQATALAPSSQGR